ncbi:hypothetical protein [Sediminibacillus massiliensis]|uniref:hypothetical protein n=1 Tax=Sediminibacillus massiliensis TaxID=1926277 RepID=UPI001FE45F6B|nr:hypothetical protein [Sediminibacillus massiliensis]
MKHLFLFGGSPPFSPILGGEFASISLSKSKPKIGVLFVERPGWKDYMTKYTASLEAYGLRDFLFLPLSPYLSKKDFKELGSCTGIIIGGGNTEKYRNYIVDTPIGETIRRLYENGVPVAVFLPER